MRFKFKICILLPLIFSAVGCSSSDKISFKSDPFQFDTFYNDSYFLLNNRDLHEEIALASHAMALSTFNGNEDYSKRSSYLVDLWNKEKFNNIYINDSYKEKPGTDTIGFGIASKTIEDFTLIAIAVRGGFYDGEWASNLTLGETGNAKGFDQASNQVIDGFNNYIQTYDIQGRIKVWISGFSRAAITSNMTAGKLLNKMTIYNAGKIKYNSDDIYAYCFEPPMGVETTLEVARSDLYHGIHNFLNYNDLVPLVAPYEWGFVRYGNDHYYSDRLTDIYFDETEREKIISLYHFTYGAEKFAEYTVDKWKFFDIGEAKANMNNLPRASVNPSQGRFLRTLIHEMAVNGFKDRETYSINLEEGLRNLLATVFGLNPTIGKIDTSSIIDIIFEYDFIKTLFMELEDAQSAQFAMDVQMLILQIFGANEENFEAVKELYNENFTFFYLLPQSFLVRKDIVSQLLYRDNALGIAIGHMPELSYSFLSATDSRFLGKRACKFNDGTYYILHIDQPREFSLFEKNIKKEVFAYKDGKMSSDRISAEQFADGSIDIYLPKNGEYEYIGGVGAISLGSHDPLKGSVTTLNNTLSTTSGEF